MNKIIFIRRGQFPMNTTIFIRREQFPMNSTIFIRREQFRQIKLFSLEYCLIAVSASSIALKK